MSTDDDERDQPSPDRTGPTASTWPRTSPAPPRARARPSAYGGQAAGGADRRTGPAKSSGAFPDDRDPQLLDVTVNRLVDDHGWDVDLRVAGMFARWPELVGEEVARHATPESFADGTLVVRTDSTAWATQLKLLAPAVVRRLNEDLGHGTVTPDRGGRPPPADLEEGRSVGPRRTRPARHLRLTHPLVHSRSAGLADV